MKLIAHVAIRYNFSYKVLNLQLVVNSITKHSLLAWATCAVTSNFYFPEMFVRALSN